MSTLILLFIIIFAPISLGKLLFKVLKIDFSSGILFSSMYFVGYSVITYVILLVGIVFNISKLTVGLILVLSCIPGLFLLHDIKTQIVALFISVKEVLEKTLLHDKILLVILFLVFLINLFSIFAPPTVADSLTYHFRIPLDYILQGKIFYHSFLPYNNPHLTELFSVIPLLWKNEIILQFVFYFFNVLLALSVLSYIKKVFNLTTALVSTVLFLSYPVLANIFASGHVEVALTVTSFLAVIGVIELQGSTSGNVKRWIYLSAIMSGISCGIKYYGLYTAFFTTVFIVVMFLGKKISLKEIFLYFLFLFIFGTPFYVKSFIFTGNPLYPILSSFITTRDWATGHSGIFKLMVGKEKMPFGHGIGTFLISPWLVSFKNYLFNGYGNGFGPIVVVLVPLIFIKNKIFRYDFFKVVTFYSVFIWTIWFFSAFQRERHLIVVYLFVTILASKLIVDFWSDKEINIKYFKISLSAFLIILLCFNLSTHIVYSAKYARFVLTNESKDHFLNKYLNNWKDLKWLNNNIPVNAKILNYYGNINYYINRDSYYPSPYFQGEYDFSQIGMSEEYLSRIKYDGFTHILTRYKKRLPVPSGPLHKYMQKYFMFHDDLLEKYSTKIYYSETTVPTRRTLAMGNKIISFSVYKIN